MNLSLPSSLKLAEVLTTLAISLKYTGCVGNGKRGIVVASVIVAVVARDCVNKESAVVATTVVDGGDGKSFDATVPLK